MTLSLSAIRAPRSRTARSVPLGRYFTVWAERRALAAMDNARLRDLGITPRDAASDEEARRASRLVFLRANDDFVGIIGLLQYRKPAKPAMNQGDEPFSTGSIVLLFNAQDLDATFDRARAVHGVRVLSEPSRVEYPSYDGKGTIPVMVSVVTDPDGFVVELNQLLVDKLR